MVHIQGGIHLPGYLGGHIQGGIPHPRVYREAREAINHVIPSQGGSGRTLGRLYPSAQTPLLLRKMGENSAQTPLPP